MILSPLRLQSLLKGWRGWNRVRSLVVTLTPQFDWLMRVKLGPKLNLVSSTESDSILSPLFPRLIFVAQIQSSTYKTCATRIQDPFSSACFADPPPLLIQAWIRFWRGLSVIQAEGFIAFSRSPAPTHRIWSGLPRRIGLNDVIRMRIRPDKPLPCPPLFPIAPSSDWVSIWLGKNIGVYVGAGGGLYLVMSIRNLKLDHVCSLAR